MREGHDDEGKAKVNAELDRAALLPHPFYELFKIYAPKKSRYKRTRTTIEAGIETKKSRAIGGWVKPEGWVPPGWKDDSTAYRDAMRVASNLGRA